MSSEAAELLELQRDLDKLEKLKEDHALIFFRPNEPQEKMSLSASTYRCLFGANKVGKSTWGIVEDICFALGYRPYLPSDHPRFFTPFKPPVKGMCFAETWDKADEVLTPHFKKWLQKGMATPVRRQGRTVGWSFKNGSEILYSTYQMDPARLEGADKHFYHFDEPPPYSFWAPITRGIVVHGGRIWLTLTLLKEGWIWDEIYERADAGDPDYFAVVGDIRHNLKRENDDGTVTGALSEEAIHKFEKGLTEVEKEVRIHGRPQHLQGRIFKHFHVKKPWVVDEWELPDEWPAIRAFDPHLAKPIAGLWGRVSPSGRLIITDELFDRSIENLDQLRERIRAIEQKRNHSIKMSLMDSQANQRDFKERSKSMIDIFSDYGIRATPAPKADKWTRLVETAEWFKLDQYTDEPRIIIFKNCEHLVWEIKRYVHPELRSKSRTEVYKDLPEGKDKKDDDLIDCLQYMVSQNPTYERLTRRSTGWVPKFVPSRTDATFAEEYGQSYAGTENEPVYYKSY